MYEKRNPKMKRLLLCSSLITMIIVSACVGVVFVFAGDDIADWTTLLILIILGFSWVISLIMPFARYHWYRASFTDEQISLREGFIMITEEIVPIERIQKISLESGPLDRMFGMTKLVVYTAGGDVTIRFMEKERAQEIGDRLKARINKYVVDARD
jgi:membrane protein YdbS with pleckstrin-like domain